MKELLELNQIVYKIIKTQIEFGAYIHDDHLPPIEEMAELLAVSLDTVRLAYRQLQREGYITLQKSIGSVVIVQYGENEIEENIRTFFAQRREALPEINRCLLYLVSGIQLQAWKSISQENLYKIEHDILNRNAPMPYKIILYLQTLYDTLKNDLLISLIRKLYMDYMVPFLYLKTSEKNEDAQAADILYKIELCRREDWPALRTLITDTLNRNYDLIEVFYKTRISVPASKSPYTFTWSGYKKVSQVCYSIGLDILRSITYGNYPKESFLPSLRDLAKEKQVSVSTIRHTLALLNDLGVVKTINGIGTQILSLNQITENCNLSNQTVQKRLLNCKHSLQLLLLSCRNVAALTVSSLDEAGKSQWIELLESFERKGKLELISPYSLQFISHSAPYQPIRVIYAELYQLLFWGAPLRGMTGSQEIVNETYLPYYQAMVLSLKNSDAEGFAAKLEEVLAHEYTFVCDRLAEFGISETDTKPVKRRRIVSL